MTSSPGEERPEKLPPEWAWITGCARRAAWTGPVGDGSSPSPRAGAEAVFASLFEFPLRIGAALGGADAEAFRACGTTLGRLFLRVEDVLALRGDRTRLDTTLPDLLDGRISALPERLAVPGLTAGELPPHALRVAVAAPREAYAEFEQDAGRLPDRFARGLLGAAGAWVAAPVSTPAGPA
ncbi:hypothetical protein ILP97_36360 [Amycolatopsis sp. H6(2020)]|nr:hypothetical protein [Amycolatopsis sp. H6(2020)]